LPAGDVDDFRFIRTVPSGRWPTITQGTYRVGDAVDVRVMVVRRGSPTTASCGEPRDAQVG